MTSWAEHASRGNLTVKGRRADGEQARIMALITNRCVAKGSGDIETIGGAIATAIQESGCRNLNHGDRDSLGIYQQRPSMGWGSAAQITGSGGQYAVDKFLSIYIPYRRQGLGWLQASHRTQRSAHPNAPAKWYGESVRAAQYYRGSGAGVVAATGSASSDGGTSTSVTREKPYEFARGSPDKRENSWDCIGRLAEEVRWRRYTSNGRFWFASDDWLIAQPVIYRMQEGARGVLEVSFEFETRKEAAEATVKVLAQRYEVFIGAVVELVNEGPASGKWLVANTRQSLDSRIVEVQLRRPNPKLKEPAAETETVTVSGNAVPVGMQSDGAGGGTLADRVYQAAQQATSFGWPYRLTQRTLVQRPPSADCSSGVSWCLLKAGIPLPGGVGWGKWAPVSGNFLGWGQPGRGQRVTVWTNAGHIWIQFHGFSNWRFDTGGGSGGKLWGNARSTGGFTARHWSGT